MKKETKKLEIDEWKNKYLRALADYQNFEKRVREEKDQLIRTANLNLILKLLPFLDNLEKAEVFVKDQGLKMAKDHLFQMLKEVGVEEIEVLNKQFDPVTSEAIDIVKGDKDDVVVEVLRKGYKLGDRILRVAQVKVSKKL
ncbi:MAG: Protein GrpE [Candidatus Roizmanbacteria bacterium GW2011_GWC2_37_13]|uniref:Protein GrpE n=1 Tax=Candidatus Roizmanbacteria bacterium GW2011_GWC2_37_13 TaxID=1618486 RepID=A0A0G0G5U2_9BACT|nr:MAG: Protein GrpE [Candidatus Roizmanbacteria bacterium GW2011_GWC1_37_12]KKQ25422.1 MAG: Protein GrpE [Candidatus Roizmanbacteria bacterium GW2011_GWC2_37_13]